MKNTRIAWTDHTQNFWTGCTKISPGCDRCYMFTAQTRYGRTPEQLVRTGPGIWKQPLTWNRDARITGTRTRIFTCSWSDFFHPDADPWRADAWDIIRDTPHLDYQILTKRPGRITQSLPADWGAGWSNVWLGVSIESRDYLWRLETLKAIPAAVHFVSFEPLLAAVAPVDLSGIEWVIVGGESGPGFRPMNHQWAREIRDACQVRGTAFFFKQSAALYPERGAHLLETDGRATTIREYPNHGPQTQPVPTREPDLSLSKVRRRYA